MADGRRNNGGPRPNSGRPKKADEIAKIEMMDRIAKPEEVWEQLWLLCLKGDTQAIRTWVDHRFGKPKERKEHDFTSNPFIAIENRFHDFSDPSYDPMMSPDADLS